MVRHLEDRAGQVAAGLRHHVHFFRRLGIPGKQHSRAGKREADDQRLIVHAGKIQLTRWRDDPCDDGAELARIAALQRHPVDTVLAQQLLQVREALGGRGRTVRPELARRKMGGQEPEPPVVIPLRMAQHEVVDVADLSAPEKGRDDALTDVELFAAEDGGKIKTLGSPAELKVGLGGDIVSLTLKDRSKIPTLVSALTGQPAMRAVKATPGGLDIRVESPEKALPAILESANRLDCHLEFIEYHRPRLDDVFIAHTGRSMTESVQDIQTV